MIYTKSLSQQQVCLNARVIISLNNTANHYTILFSRDEIHMTDCITVFRTVSKTCTTIAQTRPFETQRLGAELFCKEHTKPLFNKLGILAFQNLFNYQICIET